MLKKILVPLDGSALADRILPQVRRLLLREDAEVFLLRVLADIARGPDDARGRTAVKDATDCLRAHWQRLSDQGARVRFDLMQGDPAEQILRFAETYHPDLLAMCTHGLTGEGRWPHGSVASRVLHHSTHPLLLCTPQSRHGEPKVEAAPFGKILVPLDGSDFSARILPVVEPLARLYESELVLVHAVTLPSLDAACTPGPHPDLDGIMQEVLRPYLEHLASAGLRARARLSKLGPARAILDAAREENADLIAMTTHGRAGISRWMFGSVAQKVLSHCGCPVLVVRPSGRPHASAVQA
ncbi:MAG: universal stress protein [Planctomycetes bacterium]|nr:universal stress protein [Planctomycetota bacterium]